MQSLTRFNEWQVGCIFIGFMFVYLQFPQRLRSAIKGIPVKLLKLRHIQKCNRMPILLILDLNLDPGLAPVLARSVQTNQTQSSVPLAYRFKIFRTIVHLFWSLRIVVLNMHRPCVTGRYIYTERFDLYLLRYTTIWESETHYRTFI